MVIGQYGDTRRLVLKFEARICFRYCLLCVSYLSGDVALVYGGLLEEHVKAPLVLRQRVAGDLVDEYFQTWNYINYHLINEIYLIVKLKVEYLGTFCLHPCLLLNIDVYLSTYACNQNVRHNATKSNS